MDKWLLPDRYFIFFVAAFLCSLSNTGVGGKMKSKHDVIVIRPGLVYLFFSFMPIVLGVTYFWVLGKALPSDNPEVDKMARLILLLFFLTVGIVSGLYSLLTKIKIDNEKIEITRFPLKKKEYFWFDITTAKIINEALAYPCVIYTAEKRIAKVPRAYIGYEKLLNELSKRKIIEEDDLYLEARGMLAFDKLKLRDLFRR